MAWRFQASKFKNTTPKVPKKEDTITDCPIGNLSCTNNGIQSSADYIAFHIEGEGGKLGVLPANAKGRKLRADIGIVCAHGDAVDDFSFMTYNDDLLATCSRDDKLKVWQIGGKSELDVSLAAEIDVGAGNLMEALRPHSTASGIVALASTGCAYVVDIEAKELVLQLNGVTDKGQSLDWSEDGKLLAVSGDKGRIVHIYDPRSGSQAIHDIPMHQGLGREGRLLFCGNRLISSGFTNKRVQEVRVLDTAKLTAAPIHQQEFVSTTGVLIPHYDPDTRLVFLAGKGTNKMFLMEMQDRAPMLSHVFELTVQDQILGSCIGSKRRVAVMEGEVDKFYQLTKNSIVPMQCIVPRRSYRDFHPDLFPDTRGEAPACTAELWFAGNTAVPAKMSLAPSGLSFSPPPQEPTPRSSVTSVVSTPKTPVAAPRPSQVHIIEEPKPSPPSDPTTTAKSSSVEVQEHDYSKYLDKKRGSHSSNHSDDHPKENVPSSATVSPTEVSADKTSAPVAKAPSSATIAVKLRAQNNQNGGNRPLSTRVRPKSCVVGQLQSKYRHVETLAGLKANNALFTNLRNVNTRLPPECNGAVASAQFVAVPLSGPAGVIGIYDVDAPEKIPDGVLDGIYNKAQVTDVQFNPFDDGELAIGTDCGHVNFWNLSKNDGARNEMEPSRVLRMAGEKVLCMKWHPIASDLLAVALSDNSIELWHTKELVRKLKIVSHTSPVLAMAWSADGRRLASVGKDLLLNIHEPQLGSDCLIGQKKVLEGSRAARVLYACDDRLILVVAITKSSSRQVQLYDATTLNAVYSQSIDNATQPLIPYYDFDSNVLFLSGKGDRIISMYEVSFDSPYLLPLTNYMAPTGGQAIAFHNKRQCNVMAVEFQRAWRLTEKTLEGLVFRVPRIKKDVFQADLFPDALVTWKATTTANEWLAGSQATPLFESLKPDGVATSGGAAAGAPKLARKADFPDTPVVIAKEPVAPLMAAVPHIPAEPDKKEVEQSWSSKIVKDNGPLEQDGMDGVDETEWNEAL